MNSKQLRSSTTETPGSGIFSQAIKPALTLSIGTVTVGTALLAHATLHVNVPFPLLMGLAILSVVLPRCRAVVVATLCLLYGVVLLVVGTIYPIVARKDPGDYLTGLLDKVVNIVMCAPAPVPAPTSDYLAREPHARTPASPVEPLPAAGNVALKESAEICWPASQVMTERRSHDEQSIAQAPDSLSKHGRGRHAKTTRSEAAA